MTTRLVRLNDWNLGKGVLPSGTVPYSGTLPSPKGRTVKPVRGTLNKLEGRYAKHLEAQVLRGELAGFWFEPMKFRLADKTYYAPDFLVMRRDGLLELHEVKGWMQDDAAVKLKVTAEAYWLFPVKLAKEKGGAWTVTEVGR